MQLGDYREVRFDIFCKHCKNKKLKDTDEPCDECLSCPTVSNSRKPLYFNGNKKAAMRDLKKWDCKRRKESSQ